MLEALLNTKLDLDSLEPDSVLEEEWIKEAVTRSGMKFRWAKLSESRERANRDAQRRWVGGWVGGVRPSLCEQSPSSHPAVTQACG